MTRFGWFVLSLILLILICALGIIIWFSANRYQSPPQGQATTTPVVDPSALSIYTSGEYGFTFFYPDSATVTDSFSTGTSSSDFSHLSWRSAGTGDGTLVARVQLQDDSEVRVGMSDADEELDACTKAEPSEDAVDTITMGSTTWSRFSSQKLGTDDQRQVMSYRTVHNDHCFALETFDPISSVAKETATSSSPLFTAADIAKSFMFAQ